MKLQKILFVCLIIELCLVPLLDAKRSFGMTRSRNKNKGPSVRRNQHGGGYDDGPPAAPAHPKPATPELRKPVGYNNHSPPLGPQPAYPIGPHSAPGYGAPPAYPGMGHHSAAPYGAPPAYSPSYSNPPGYSNAGMGFNQPNRFGQQMPGAYSQPGFGGGGMPMGGMGGMGSPMGVSPMGASNYGYGRNTGFGSGIMTNLFAGLAGYQLARAFSGGHGSHHRDREVIVIDNRQPINTNPSETVNAEQTASLDAQSNIHVSTEIPQTPMTQVGPAENEYNYYGIPQYGVPLYGYSLPAQITDYYQTAIVSLPQSIPQPPAYELTDQPLASET